MTEAAQFALNGKALDLPVLPGSVGPRVVDIRKLYGGTGAFTFDPGFTSTASCESGLTYIDGDAGVPLPPLVPADQGSDDQHREQTACRRADGEPGGDGQEQAAGQQPERPPRATGDDDADAQHGKAGGLRPGADPVQPRRAGAVQAEVHTGLALIRR